MTKKSKNIYKTYRKHAGYTQEQASEKLNVMVRKLSDYENGHAPVPLDIAAKMAEIYGRPKLAVLHMKQTSEISKYLPDITEEQSAENATMCFMRAVKQFAPYVDDLLDAADGVTSAETEKRAQAVVNRGLDFWLAREEIKKALFKPIG